MRNEPENGDSFCCFQTEIENIFFRGSFLFSFYFLLGVVFVFLFSFLKYNILTNNGKYDKSIIVNVFPIKLFVYRTEGILYALFFILKYARTYIYFKGSVMVQV